MSLSSMVTLADDINSTLSPIFQNATGNSTGSEPGIHLDICNDCKHLTWIKVGILAAILICLILIKVTFCVAACYLMGILNNQRTSDLENQIIKSRLPVTDTAGQVITQSPKVNQSAPPERSDKVKPSQGLGGMRSEYLETPTTEFTQLSLAPTLPRPPLASSIETNTFSAYMAPPSPKSASIGPGLETPEEAVVKRMAIDRIELEEAKRHQDLALMANKSSSLTKLSDELKTETSAAAAASKASSKTTQTSSTKSTVNPNRTKTSRPDLKTHPRHSPSRRKV